MSKPVNRRLPPTGAAREALRQKGQFWTPQWVADAMTAYVLHDNPGLLFDPAVGTGAFFKSAKRISRQRHMTVALHGREIDRQVLTEAIGEELEESDLRGVELRDFVFDPPLTRYPAVIANPPYLRHHRLAPVKKEKLRELVKSATGMVLDARAGFHVYFFIQALLVLQEGGRLAFILPADTCEGVFSRQLWRWITANYALDAVITFTPEASPFPRVDTNAFVALIRKSAPSSTLHWARCEAVGDGFRMWVEESFKSTSFGISSCLRDTDEALSTGLTREPQAVRHVGPVLGDFAYVVRGIATGDNEFFFLTAEQASSYGLPAEYLQRAIGRTRDVRSDIITEADLRELEREGRPTLLLSIDGQPKEALPDPVQRYLAAGEARGLPSRPLIATRKPWYKMETRKIPPFLFTYLGRRSSRFIRNEARAVPLTGFLCVYPLNTDPVFIERLGRVLSHPDTVANLQLVGKSYGNGAIKVEPRALERLPIPRSALECGGWGLGPHTLDFSVAASHSI